MLSYPILGTSPLTHHPPFSTFHPSNPHQADQHHLPLSRPSSIMVDPRPTIKNADMAEDMQQEAVECAVRAFEKYTVEKDIAAFMKKEFDKKYGSTWHCIVGRNFGSYVTHGKHITRKDELAFVC